MNPCSSNCATTNQMNTSTLPPFGIFTESYPVRNLDDFNGNAINTCAENVESIADSIFQEVPGNQAPVFAPSVDDNVDDNWHSRQITIKYQVRQQDRLRTRVEHEKAAHFIQCEDNEDRDAKYPTINVEKKWLEESDENYIDVTLLNRKNETHLYEIDYKKKKSSKTEEENLIQKVEDVENTLRFRLTPDDFRKGFKTFEIKIIKSTIPEIARKLFSTQIDAASEPSPEQKEKAKNYIQENELSISKLSFTRLYRHPTINRDKLYIDENSTVYSSEMMDAYSSMDRVISVDGVIPRFGPKRGGEDLLVVFRNIKPTDKDKLLFKISDEANTWIEWITDFQLNAPNVRFQMPACASTEDPSIKTTITVYYNQQPIFESPFIYSVYIDDAFKKFNIQPVSSNENNPTKNPKTKKRSSSAVSKKRQNKKR